MTVNADPTPPETFQLSAWEISAREQIRQTIASYTWAGDGFRLADLAAQFAEEGVLHVAGREPAQGRAAIVEMLGGGGEGRAIPESIQLPGGGFFIRHMITNILIEDVTATTAKARSYFVVFTPAGVDHWGRYRDDFVLEDGSWKFQNRFVRVDDRIGGSPWLNS